MYRILRYTRIAFSCTCAIACALLIVVWARSYWRFDQFARLGSNATYFGCTSAQGRVLLGSSNDPMLSTVFGTRWIRREFSLKNWDEATNIAFFPASVSKSDAPAIFSWLQFNRNFYIQSGASYEITLPYWLLVVPFATLAAIPWMRWRFSLRTLLIATTVIAAILGAIVVALH